MTGEPVRQGTARVLCAPDAGTERVAGGYGIASGAPGANAILESYGIRKVVVLTNFDPPTAEHLGSAALRAPAAT